MSSRQALLKEFKSQLIMFFDELIEQFPREGNLLVIRIFLNDQVSKETIIKHFIDNIIPIKDEINKRNEKFFTENENLFGVFQTSYNIKNF